MKILHTSDWHLGKFLHAINLVPDQRYVLEQIISMVEEEKPDAVVVAGDIYDRAVPPAEAVELLDWVLTELVLRLKTPTVIIAGNHDSPDRLQFGSALLRQNGLFVVGRLDSDLDPIRVGQHGQEGLLCPLPFVEPAIAREYLQDDRITSYESALRAMTEQWRERCSPKIPSVLIAHAYVAGGCPSDSERTLSVGGSEQVPVDCFDGFDYVALGHLHRPQWVKDPQIRYSGSILKYSRSETATSKSVSLVRLEAQGQCEVQERPLTPRHDVREIQGFLTDIEQRVGVYGNPEDFLFVKLLDPAMPVHAMSRLRAHFPNIIDVDISTALNNATDGHQVAPLLGLDDITLFDTFMKSVTGVGLTSEEQALVGEAISATQDEPALS
jgi:exonuclease SbcD